MEDTSFGVGISFKTSGNFWVLAFSKWMEKSPASDVTRRPFILRVSLGGPTPWIVAMVWCVEVRSSFSMANRSMAFGHTNVVEA